MHVAPAQCVYPELLLDKRQRAAGKECYSKHLDAHSVRAHEFLGRAQRQGRTTDFWDSWSRCVEQAYCDAAGLVGDAAR
eukprot:2516199-Alexandrium_andersonii.AAC.1